MRKTRTIAGQTLTLTVGKRYVASRPMLDAYKNGVPVFIRDAKTRRLIWSFGILPRKAADRFLNEFNNEAASWSGRIWK